ncbi:hypothetical protein [uncultured Sphingomonas sp.]|uniref:hypothetical protein n=1 Tax=uncultured Sphingomonas sp. TaxID=158754 RepID=UPI0025E9A704|nr:hypothetical protein [uncultured Sphingomonas sp.]
MTWAGALALARRFWWAVPMLALLAALLLTRERLADKTLTLTNERAAWSAALRDAEAAKLKAEARFARQLAQAAAAYADRAAAREPIIVRSINTVREYAQTDAGRVLCRGADRVRAIDGLDAELAETSGTASRSTGALSAEAAASPAGR